MRTRHAGMLAVVFLSGCFCALEQPAKRATLELIGQCDPDVLRPTAALKKWVAERNWFKSEKCIVIGNSEEEPNKPAYTRLACNNTARVYIGFRSRTAAETRTKKLQIETIKVSYSNGKASESFAE